MAKSRIKSEEEYNEILGVKQETQENVVTNDANSYFNKVNEESNETNPFNGVVSLDELKRNLKKDELASNEMRPRVEPEEKELADYQRRQTFNFEENSKKLYENLRGSHIGTRRNVNKNASDVKVNEIDIIDEGSVVNKPTFEGSTIPNTSPLAQEFNRFEYSEPIDKMDLTADFTAENENFIDAINLQKQKIEMPAFTSEIQTPPAFQEEVSEPVQPGLEPEAKTIVLEDDLASQLDQQLASLNNDAIQEEVKQSEPAPLPFEHVFPTTPHEQPQIEELVSNRNLSDEIDQLTKSKPKANLNDTLSIALDPEHASNFSPDDLDALRSNEINAELEKSKRRPVDVIITVVLVVLILVLAFFIIKSLLNQ